MKLCPSSFQPLPTLTLKSITDTSAHGTRNAMPLSLPLREGSTFEMAFAAPVADGIMFKAAALPVWFGDQVVGWVGRERVKVCRGLNKNNNYFLDYNFFRNLLFLLFSS